MSEYMIAIFLIAFLLSPFFIYMLVLAARYGYLRAGQLFFKNEVRDKFQKRRDEQ